MSVPVTIPNTAAYEEHVFADGAIDFVVGFIRQGDHLFGTTLAGGHMVRLNKDNLATNSILDFGGAPLHIRGWDMAYVPGSSSALDRIYVVFANDTNLTISSVNPNPTPMTFTDVITETGGQGSASIATDGTYLYVVRDPDPDSSDTIIYRYTLDGSFTKTTLTLTGYRRPKCIRAHGGFVYVTGFQTDSSATTSWLAKVNTTTFLLDTATRFERGSDPGATINDLAITPMHVWIRDAQGRVQKCPIANITSFEIIDTGFASDCTAVAPDGAYCWAVFENGKAVRINTSTNEQRVYTLNPGQNYFGNIALDNENIYAVRHEVGTVVSKYAIDTEPGAFHWVKVVPASTSSESLTATASDADGNIAAHGIVNNAPYICKYRPDGTLIWERGTSGFANSHGIAMDADGNVFIIGEYQGPCNLGGDPLSGSLSGFSIYVAKYRASDGAHLKSKGFRPGSSQNSNFGLAIAADLDGNAVITGKIADGTNFGGGALSGSGIFVAKLDATTLDEIWAEGPYGIGEGRGVDVDSSDNVWLTGFFQATVDFGGGTLTASLGQAVFVTKLNSAGVYVWADKFGNWSSNDSGNGGAGLAIAPNNDVVISGGFVGTINFGGGNMVNSNTTNPHAFFARLNNSGGYIWQKQISGAYQVGYACDTDSNGNMAFAGINSNGDYGAGVRTGVAFVAKYSAAGVYAWDKTYDTRSPARGVCCDLSGNVVACGAWNGTMDFGDGDRTSAGIANDLFLLKLGP